MPDENLERPKPADKNVGSTTNQPTPASTMSETGEAAAPDEDLLRLFVGKNPDNFIRIHRKIASGKRLSAFEGFNPVILLAALPWFFYRKLYFFGICILMAPILLVVLFPQLATVSMAGGAMGLAMFINQVYVMLAMRRIAKIKALGLPTEERDERIRKAGGTSPAGAAFGSVIVVAMVSLQFLELPSTDLPGCDDAHVHELTQNSVAEYLEKNGVNTQGLALSNFEPLESKGDGSGHLCRLSARLGGQNTDLFVAVTWADNAHTTFQVEVNSTRDGLAP